MATRFKRNCRLETHRYAPELNKLWVEGRPFKVPGAVSIREAVLKLGWDDLPSGTTLLARVWVKHEESHRHLDKHFGGFVASRAEGLRKLREYQFKGPHVKEPTVLTNGDILNPPKYGIRFLLRG